MSEIIKGNLIFHIDEICKTIKVSRKQKGRGKRPKLIFEYSWKERKVYDE